MKGRNGDGEGMGEALGGGVREGQFGVGWGGVGVHAPKAERWSITRSPYLPLPSL